MSDITVTLAGYAVDLDDVALAIYVRSQLPKKPLLLEDGLYEYQGADGNAWRQVIYVRGDESSSYLYPNGAPYGSCSIVPQDVEAGRYTRIQVAEPITDELVEKCLDAAGSGVGPEPIYRVLRAAGHPPDESFSEAVSAGVSAGVRAGRRRSGGVS